MNLLKMIKEKAEALLEPSDDLIEEAEEVKETKEKIPRNYKLILQTSTSLLDLGLKNITSFSNHLSDVGINNVRFGPCEISIHQVRVNMYNPESIDRKIYVNKLKNKGIWIDTEFEPEDIPKKNRYERKISARYKIYTHAVQKENPHPAKKELMLYLIIKTHISIFCKEATTLYDTILMDSLNKYVDKVLFHNGRFKEYSDGLIRIPSIIQDGKVRDMHQANEKGVIKMDDSIINFRKVKNIASVPEFDFSDTEEETTSSVDLESYSDKMILSDALHHYLQNLQQP